MTIRSILILDDEDNTLLSLRTALLTFGYRNVITCRDPDTFRHSLRKHGAQIIILDLVMPGISGEEILSSLKNDFPEIPVIITTGINDVATAVRCMKTGAFDYLTKPIQWELLKIAVDRAVTFSDLQQRNTLLERVLSDQDLSHPEHFHAIITNDISLKSQLKYIEAIAGSSEPVLITGETGTGKELIARAVHAASERNGKFIAVNVAGLDDATFTDTLFGHVKGAFTGADNGREGLVKQAEGGTLFLDEIGDLSSASQIKLLRLLQERTYFALGDDTPLRTTCRIVTATARTIHHLKSSSGFRNDLFYRLKTHQVHLPPLRNRKDDLPLLVTRFISSAANEMGKNAPTPHHEIIRLLSTYDFPGNVRELKAIIYDAVARHDSNVMSLTSIREAIGIENVSSGNENIDIADEQNVQFGRRLPTFKKVEELLLKEALHRTSNNRSLAAKLLGVTPSAISQRISKLNSTDESL